MLRVPWSADPRRRARPAVARLICFSNAVVDREHVIRTAPPSTPSPQGLTPRALVGGICDAIWATVSAAPWLGVVIGLLILTNVTRVVRTAIHSGPKDPIRRFSRADKAVILSRAGYRCEHHIWLTGRCKATERLEADHVHPHSRGGWTRISNGQILCKRHNQTKRAAIPYNFQLRALEKRRLQYFPAGTPSTITRRPNRGKPQSGRSQSDKTLDSDR
ncbi:HNH endonuclease [Jatrophihabitans sp. DSM 45814]